MAISVDTFFKKVPVKGAYVTVEFPTIQRGKDSVEFGLWFCAERGVESFHSETRTAPYALDGGDPFLQAYLHLKTLPEFEGCIDC